MNELVLVAMSACLINQRLLEAALIGMVMSLHELIEHWTPSGASIGVLQALDQDKSLVRLVSGEVETEVAIESVKPGDFIRILPGERIPVDGTLHKGQSQIEQSLVTGEAEPVTKNPGDEIFAGTLNLSAPIIVLLSSTSKDSTVSKMRDLVINARESRSGIASLLDRYAGSYALLVLGIALATYYFTHDLDKAIAFIIIGFPDALVMASPLVMLGALASASRVGVIIREPQRFLDIAHCRTLLLDKTGTLTRGRPQVLECQKSEPEAADEDLAIAAALADASHHPVSRALQDFCGDRKAALEDIQEFPGLGLEGRLGHQSWRLGRPTWAAEISPGLIPDKLFSEASVALCRNDGLRLAFRLDDGLRPGLVDTIEELRPYLKIRILSGDRDAAVQALAKRLDLEARGECLPGEKWQELQDARQNGKVLFAGDGMNDAPAIAAADAGICFRSAGNDLTLLQSSAVILSERFDRVGFLWNLSRRARQLIWLNIAVGLCFSIVGSILAFSGYLSPTAAAFAHLLDAAFIVGNSARILRCGEDLEGGRAIHPS
jgi:Zn2+/Cd2+-exporting ATPase